MRMMRMSELTASLTRVEGEACALDLLRHAFVESLAKLPFAIRLVTLKSQIKAFLPYSS